MNEEFKCEKAAPNQRKLKKRRGGEEEGEVESIEREMAGQSKWERRGKIGRK